MNEKYTELMQLIEQVDDAQLREKMATLLGQLPFDLSNTESTELLKEDDDVLDQLETAINKLEAEHPEVTTLLNNVMQSLSNLGI